jgi:hypothetical protein
MYRYCIIQVSAVLSLLHTVQSTVLFTDCTGHTDVMEVAYIGPSFSSFSSLSLYLFTGIHKCSCNEFLQTVINYTLTSFIFVICNQSINQHETVQQLPFILFGHSPCHFKVRGVLIIHKKPTKNE